MRKNLKTLFIFCFLTKARQPYLKVEAKGHFIFCRIKVFEWLKYAVPEEISTYLYCNKSGFANINQLLFYCHI